MSKLIISAMVLNGCLQQFWNLSLSSMHPFVPLLALVVPIVHGQDGRHHLVLNHRRLANHPTFLEGNLGMLPGSVRFSSLSLGEDQAPDEASLKQAGAQVLQTIAKDFLGATGNETIVPTSHKIFSDGWGGSHLRYTQVIDDLPVEGTALIMHVSKNGTVTAVNGAFVTSSELEHQKANLTCAKALKIAILQYRSKEVDILGDCEQTIVLGRDGRGALAWKQMVGYQPVRGPYQKDVVFASRVTGDLVAIHPKVYGATSFETYDCKNGYNCTTLVSDSPTRISTGDPAIDGAHNYGIATYEFYYNNFGRDSFDDKGMTLISNVHFLANFTVAFWVGTQMYYGDGDGKTLASAWDALAQWKPSSHTALSGVEFIAFSRDADIVGHEITHGVTERSSGLIYMDESGALSEAMSDIMGAGVDRQEGATIEQTFLFAEDVYTPGTAGDAGRYMADPEKAGDYDFWPTRYTGPRDNGGVHWNSGIANLAFTLMVQGGSHPRGKTTVVVPPIHSDFDVSLKAALTIFYKANVGCLTPDSNFLAARLCTMLHAGEFSESVSKAWDAVGVPTGPVLDHIPLSDRSSLPLQDAATNDVTLYSLGGVRKGESVTCTTEGDNGEARLFVRFDADPEIDLSSSVNDCVSSTAGLVAQRCTTGTTTASSSTAFVAVEAVSSYQNLKITCLRNRVVYAFCDGVPMTDLSAPSGDYINFKISGVRGNVVECKTYGPSVDSGDANLFLRVGAIPDILSGLFDCASVASGSTETCTILQLPSDNTVYASLVAYNGFSGVSITCNSWNYVDLTAGSPESVSAIAATTLHFRVQNIEAGTAMECWTVGYQDSNHVQLFTRFGTLPEIDVASTLNACVSANGGPDQCCSTYPAPEDTYLAVSLYTPTGFQSVSLTCARSPILLKNDVVSKPFSGLSGETIAFKLQGVSGGQSVSCKLSANEGYVVMTVDVSTVGVFKNCYATSLDGSEAECTTKKVFAPTDVSIRIGGYSDFSGATLICKTNAASCKSCWSTCTARSECCAGFQELACDGNQSTNRRCVICLEASETCVRNTECCAGMECVNSRCE